MTGALKGEEDVLDGERLHKDKGEGRSRAAAPEDHTGCWAHQKPSRDRQSSMALPTAPGHLASSTENKFLFAAPKSVEICFDDSRKQTA